MIIVQLIAPQILELLSIEDTLLTEPVHGVLYNQLDFASTYFRINIIQLLLMAVAQVYISGLQALKKQKHIAIGAILSNVVDVAVVSLFLFIVKTNPLLAALGMPMAALFQLVYMGIISHKNIDYHKFTFRDSFNSDYAKQITKVGLPITLEIALWQICNFTMNSAISNLITIFLQATATVTSILVAKQIGMGDKEGALKAGADG
ncbi:hypothetical protein FQA39_LY12965 [Lamprigera yunnana]|nr:hypothetical protein FQA39_LY12965 [Lamprigera yunnana]